VNYLLDTNILLIYSRDSDTANEIEKEFGFFNGQHNLAISAVTLGEVNSLTKQFKYGERKKQRLNQLIEDVFVIDVNIQTIIGKYGDIDAFSQGKLEGRPLNTSSRNMGKNDLWIAATASVYKMSLATTDKDFQHLHDRFLTLNYIDLMKYKTS